MKFYIESLRHIDAELYSFQLNFLYILNNLSFFFSHWGDKKKDKLCKKFGLGCILEVQYQQHQRYCVKVTVLINVPFNQFAYY